MTPTKHGLADGHEICDHVVAISDELYDLSMLCGEMQREAAYFLEVIRNQGLEISAVRFKKDTMYLQ
jgi:hypothetical protein